MRQNKQKLITHKIYSEMGNEINNNIANLLNLNAAQLMTIMTPLEFTNLVKGLPRNSVHFLTLLMKLKFQFLDIEAYEYCIPIQKFIDND